MISVEESLGGDKNRPKSEAEKGTAYLQPYIDITDNAKIKKLYGDIPAIRFQFWPDNLQDSKPSEWNERQIPGLSHPLYNWTSGGARTLTFNAIFARDNDPAEVDDDALVGGSRDKLEMYDIESAIAWLRSFQLPSYTDEGDPLPPPKLLMVFQGMRLGLDGSRGILCILTNCDVGTQAWFPSGALRYTEANLTFNETIQRDLKVLTKSRKTLIDQTRFHKKLPSPVALAFKQIE